MSPGHRNGRQKEPAVFQAVPAQLPRSPDRTCSDPGIYTVKINVENGTVEDILYESALAGIV